MWLWAESTDLAPHACCVTDSLVFVHVKDVHFYWWFWPVWLFSGGVSLCHVHICSHLSLHMATQMELRKKTSKAFFFSLFFFFFPRPVMHACVKRDERKIKQKLTQTVSGEQRSTLSLLCPAHRGLTVPFVLSSGTVQVEACWGVCSYFTGQQNWSGTKVKQRDMLNKPPGHLHCWHVTVYFNQQKDYCSYIDNHQQLMLYTEVK